MTVVKSMWEFEAPKVLVDTACAGGQGGEEGGKPIVPSIQILRLPQVRKMTGLGRSMIYQMMALQQFPQPVKLGLRAVGWLESEVQHWLIDRINSSRGKSSRLAERELKPPRR